MKRLLVFLFLLIGFVFSEEIEKHPIKCGLSDHFFKSSGTRPIFPDSVASEHFKFHFTTTGEDSISVTDADENGIPDWIDSSAIYAEYSYHLLLDSLLLPEPPEDNQGFPEIDIYFEDTGAYGWTEKDQEKDAFENEFGRRTRWTSFIRIDNDFPPEDFFTSYYEALKVTIAHELFHVFQFGIGTWEFTDGEREFLEGNAVWMEDFAFPEVNDYLDYLPGYFDDPTRDISTYDYEFGIFYTFLVGYFGDLSFMANLWAQIEEMPNYVALEHTINGEWNSNFSNILTHFGTWNCFTGTRALEGLFYEDAALFPEIIFSDESETKKKIQINSDGVSDSLVVKKNAVSYLRIKTTGTEEISGGFESGNQLIQCQTSFHEWESDSLVTQSLLSGNPFFIEKVRSTDNLFWVFSNTSDTEKQITISLNGEPFYTDNRFLKVYPNPAFVENTKQISFLVEFQEQQQFLRLRIFDLLGREIYTSDWYRNVPEGTNLFYWAFDSATQPLGSGVYFYWIDGQFADFKGVFTIVK
ncbi:MAG: T9SS type A sorting domain-containing protein [Candidatus Marinimicrobia bacterium]|nr:T9SS type A sorting domain-containing protein [Candidatus Neomarinimicrobiota bacterium]